MSTALNNYYDGDPLQLALSQQVEFSKNMVLMYNKMMGIEQNVDEKFSEMKDMVQEVRDSVHLTRAESSKLKRAVEAKARQLTLQWIGREPESKKEFNEYYRKVITRIWRKTKEFAGYVDTYPEIRRIDFQRVMHFVESLTLGMITE